MSLSSLQADDIRQMVRTILREVLPKSTSAAPAKETVAIQSDEDLNGFALRLLAMFENPEMREAVRAGSVGFTLAGRMPSVPVQVSLASSVQLSGTITERKLLGTAKPGDTLAITEDAVVTPLARDKAKALKIELIRRG